MRTLVEIVDPQPHMSIYDPTCGSGGMLIQTRDYIRERGGDPLDLALAGQESIGTTWSICKNLRAATESAKRTFTRSGS